MNGCPDIVTENQTRFRKIKARRSLIEREAVGVACGSAGGCRSLKRKFYRLGLSSPNASATIEKCEQRGDIDGLGDLFITPPSMAKGRNVFRRIFMRRKRGEVLANFRSSHSGSGSSSDGIFPSASGFSDF